MAVMTAMRSRQGGLSLIELMVAITLGLLLTVAVIQVFLSSRGVFRMQDAQSRLQENARFAMDYLARDIRMAGFMGCPHIERIPVNNIATDSENFSLTPDLVLNGADDVSSTNDWDAVEGTDVLNIRRASPGSAQLTGNTSPNNANIQVVNAQGVPQFAAGDILMITDCVSADVFRATNVSQGSNTITMAHASDVNIDNKLSKSYGTDAEVYQYESIEYFVRDTGRTTVSGEPVHGLFMRRWGRVGDLSLTPTAVELIEGVEDMQLQYGVDLTGDRRVDQYVDGDAVTDWGRVMSVRINLLLHSIEENVVGRAGAQVQELEFMGTALPQDGRLRQVYTSTVAVRNRLP